MSGTILRGTFDNADEYVAALQTWDVDVVQLGPGDLAVDIMHLEAGDLQFLHNTNNNKLHRCGSTPKGCRTFGIAASPGVCCTSQGRPFTSDMIRIFPKSGEMEGLSCGRFDVYCISIPNEDLERRIEALGCPHVHDLIEDAFAATPPPTALAALQGTLAEMSWLARSNMMAANYTLFEEVVASSLISCLANIKRPTFSLSCPKRVTAVHQALDYIRRHARDGIYLADLCSEIGVSERTLLYSFNDILRTTPKAYIKAYRLGNVQRDLLRGVETSVTDAATGWGFWHMGQFSVDYRKQFGESPSDTLKRGGMALSLPA